jgi:hypothetical protein
MNHFQNVETYVNFICEKTLQADKNDGKHVISRAAGAIDLGGIEYEIKVVFEPRKEKWIGDKNLPVFEKIEENE